MFSFLILLFTVGPDDQSDTPVHILSSTMQHISQKLLWTQQWLNGVKGTGKSPTEPGNPSDDTQSPDVPTTSATNTRPPATETDTSFELVSHNDSDLPNDFGVLSIPDPEPSIKELPQPPPSHCPSCGYPFPPPPPSVYSEPTPPDRPAQDLELAGRGDYSHTFSDLRSPSLARRREKSAREKYYGFRYVKRGDVDSKGVNKGGCHSCVDVEVDDEVKHEPDEQDYDDDDESQDDSPRVGTPHTASSCSTERPPQPTDGTPQHITSSPNPTEQLDKHTLYRLAQLYPRPPRNHHRHVDKITATLSQRVDKRREERKHQKAILRDELEGS